MDLFKKRKWLRRNPMLLTSEFVKLVIMFDSIERIIPLHDQFSRFSFAERTAGSWSKPREQFVDGCSEIKSMLVKRERRFGKIPGNTAQLQIFPGFFFCEPRCRLKKMF